MKKLAFLAAAACLLAGPVGGAAGKTWKTAGADQFAEGKLEGVSVLSTGRVELAPETEEIEGVEAEFVWDVEADHEGAVYVAAGAPAAVYAVREGKAELLHKSEQKHVLSVLPLPDGSVLAGTAPAGVVLRITRQGKVTTLAELKDAYVWDMAWGPDHKIYCATGPNGRLLRLSRAGEVEELLKAEQRNVLCVAVHEDGTVYAGTDTDGFVYRVGHDGATSVLYDAEESEVRDVAVAEAGTLYACTAQSQPGGPAGPPSSQGRSEPDEPPSAVAAGPEAPGAPNSLYRIDPEQGAFRLARFDRAFLLGLALRGDRVLVGTGTGGRLLSVGPDMEYRIVTEFDSAFLTSLAALPDGDVVVGASHPAGLWRVSSGVRKEGSLFSEPFDAGYLARWGRLWWKQQAGVGQQVRLRLRTGNSGEPDEHWSEWAEFATEPSGADAAVPMGRFGQFNAELSTRGNLGSPTLLEVNVSYRQANRRPLIEDLALDGESLLNKSGENGGGPGRPGPSRAAQRPSRPGGRREAPPGQRTLAWKAADPNEDDLAFRLYYRALDETEWKELDEDLRKQTSYEWDTSRVPDGHYVLKLVASDEASRPPAEALADEKLTTPLLVDNGPPAVEGLQSRPLPDGTHELTGVAADGYSHIASIEVSRNSEDWRPVFPADGIADSPQEPFSYRTEKLEPGEHVFVFAATDAAGNSGSARILLRVGPPPG
jgi:hypothetical protein